MISIALLLAAAATDTPTLMPLDEGDSWEFDGTVTTDPAHTRQVVFTVRVGAPRDVDGATEFPIEGAVAGVWGLGSVVHDMGESGAEILGTDWVRSNETGVHIVGFETEEVNRIPEEWTWISLPVEEGRSWSADLTVDPDNLHVEYRWGAAEQVETPAGTFDARRLEFAVRSGEGDENIQGTTWLAPGHGPVRLDWTFSEGGEGGTRLEARATRITVPEPQG